MLLSQKVVDLINKEIKAQANLKKGLEAQSKSYKIDNSKAIELTQKSIDYMDQMLKNAA